MPENTVGQDQSLVELIASQPIIWVIGGLALVCLIGVSIAFRKGDGQ